MTTAAEILDAVESSLKLVRTLNGYRTDAGANPVYRGLERIDDEHAAPVFSIFMPDEELETDRANCSHRDMRASVLIACWARPEAQDNVKPLLDLLADVKQAVFNYSPLSPLAPLVRDHYYKGASFLPRQDGGTFAQAVVEGVFRWRETVTA